MFPFAVALEADQRSTIPQRLQWCNDESKAVIAAALRDSKAMKVTTKRVLLCRMVRVYGNVLIDDDMYEFLGHGHEFAMLQKINRLQLEKEFLRELNII